MAAAAAITGKGGRSRGVVAGEGVVANVVALCAAFRFSILQWKHTVIVFAHLSLIDCDVIDLQLSCWFCVIGKTCQSDRSCLLQQQFALPKNL